MVTPKVTFHDHKLVLIITLNNIKNIHKSPILILTNRPPNKQNYNGKNEIRLANILLFVAFVSTMKHFHFQSILSSISTKIILLHNCNKHYVFILLYFSLCTYFKCYNYEFPILLSSKHIYY